MALTKIDDRGLTTPIDLLDNEKIRFGTGNDLELYHDGSNGWLKNGTNTLILASNLLELKNNAGDETYLKGTANGAVELYYDGTKKLETNTNGVNMSGSMYFPDGQIAGFGDLSNPDLRIYHNGTNSYLKSTTGMFYIMSSDLRLVSTDGAENYFRGYSNGAVEIYYDNAKKFETTSTGASVLGSLYCSDNLNLTNDNKKINLGDSSDLQIYHNGSHSYIDHSGAGHLYIRTEGSNEDIYIRANDNVYIQGQTNEDGVTVHGNGAVELCYDGTKKLETSSSGVTITGNLTVTGSYPGAPAAQGAKAWINWNGSTTSIRSSYNIDSLTDISQAVMDVAIDSDFSNANYAVTTHARAGTTGGGRIVSGKGTPTAGVYRFQTVNTGNGEIECVEVCAAFYGS